MTILVRRTALAAISTFALAACGSDPAGPEADDGGGYDADAPPAEADTVAGDGDEAPPDSPDEGDSAVPSRCDLAASPAVETVGTLAAGRYAPAAAALEDGSALIAGGFDFARGIQRTAEIFDPASGTLGAAGSMRSGRNFAATARLRDGSVFVVGGFDPSRGSLAGAEIFDPAGGSFRLAMNSMSAGREAHTATLLPDGRVFVAGGLQAIGFTFHSTAEIYDPSTDEFTAASVPMNSPRAFHAAVMLETRDAVLLVGGDSGRGELAGAERYELATGDFWNTDGALPRRAKAPAAALLPGGRVLVAGGANGVDGTLAGAEIYDPATDRFVPASPMAFRRMAHTLTPLGDGRVLAAGGWSDTSSPSASSGALEVFDPGSGAWETLPVGLARPRHDHVAILLGDCRVLVAGGQQVAGAGAPEAPLEVEAVTIPARR